MADNPLLKALKRSPARLASLDDDEEEGNSILGEIGRRSLSGLQKAGALLDVPGSMARDVLGGSNPFDQLLDPFGDSNRTSGRDLLRGAGLIGHQDTTGNWWGGLAAEIALDPTTYIGGLGLLKSATKGGKIAKAAGVLGDTSKLTGKGTRVAQMTTTLRQLADLAGPESTSAIEAAAAKAGTTIDAASHEPLSSLLRLEVPFTDIGMNVGTGPLAQKAAGYLDTASEAIRWSPLGRAAHGLFGPASKGLFDKGGQELAEAVSAVEPLATRQARKAVADIAGPLTEAYKEFDDIFGPDLRIKATGKIKDPTASVANVMQRTVGLVAELGGDVDEAFQQMSLPIGKLTPDLRSKLVKLGDDMQKGEGDIADTLIAKGGKLTKMEGLAGPGATTQPPPRPTPPHFVPGPAKAFHGTRSTFTTFGEKDTGGLASFTDDIRRAEDYAVGEGLNRGRLKPEDAYVFDETGIVYERDAVKGDWKAVGYTDDGRRLTNKTLPGGEALPTERMSDDEVTRLGGEHMLHVTPKSFNVLNADLSQLKFLDLTTKEGRKTLLSLDPKGNKFAQTIQNNTRANDYFLWGDTKYARQWQVWNTVLGPQLEEMGYQGIHFADDGHKTWAPFVIGGFDPASPVKAVPPIPLGDGGPAFEHLTAYGAEKPATLGGAVKTLFTKPGAFSAREEVTKNIPREIVNQIVSSDEFRGRGATQKLLAKYGKYLGRGTELAADGTKAPLWESAEKHAKALVDHIKNRDQFPIYNSNQLENFGRYMKEAHLANVNYDVIHETLAKNLDDAGIPVKEVFSQAGMEPTKAMEWLAKKVGISAEELASKGVPEDVANAIVAVRKASNDPQWMGAIGGFIDTVTKMFKENVTLPFPAFAGRNLSSGQYVNIVSGLLETPADFGAYKDSLGQAWNGLRSGDSKLLSELFVEGVIDDRMLSEGVEASGSLGWSLGKVPNPLNVPQSFGEAAADVAQSPSRIPGLDTARSVHGTVLKTGEKASASVEFMNRVPMYLYLRGKGWAPEVAAAKVKELHVDYGALAPFEKQVMRRMVPFYAFQRRMAPALLGILAERPGGAMAQTIRAASQSSGADASTPDWIASTAAIPNPFKTPAEGQSFLTGFGLPFEQFLQYGEGGMRGALREGLSQTNPLMKAPLEMATNQSFFQTGPSGAGRPLDDLDPVLGRTLANLMGREKPVQTPRTLEWALSNSPLTRAASTARQVTDPRKSPLDLGLNLLTGVRVSDVSPAAQDAVLRDRALEMMKGLGSRAFTRTYFDKDDVQNMPAPQRALAEKLTQLQSLLAERAKERRVAANR